MCDADSHLLRTNVSITKSRVLRTLSLNIYDTWWCFTHPVISKSNHVKDSVVHVRVRRIIHSWLSSGKATRTSHGTILKKKKKNLWGFFRAKSSLVWFLSLPAVGQNTFWADWLLKSSHKACVITRKIKPPFEAPAQYIGSSSRSPVVYIDEKMWIRLVE